MAKIDTKENAIKSLKTVFAYRNIQNKPDKIAIRSIIVHSR